MLSKSDKNITQIAAIWLWWAVRHKCALKCDLRFCLSTSSPHFHRRHKVWEVHHFFTIPHLKQVSGWILFMGRVHSCVQPLGGFFLCSYKDSHQLAYQDNFFLCPSFSMTKVICVPCALQICWCYSQALVLSPSFLDDFIKVTMVSVNSLEFGAKLPDWVFKYVPPVIPSPPPQPFIITKSVSHFSLYQLSRPSREFQGKESLLSLFSSLNLSHRPAHAASIQKLILHCREHSSCRFMEVLL